MPSGVYVRTAKNKKSLSLSHIGQTPWNKGVKGSIPCSSTSFEKGHVPWNKGNVGYHIIFTKDNRRKYTPEQRIEQSERLKQEYASGKRKPWNQGLTKETSAGVASRSQKMLNHVPWNKGMKGEYVLPRNSETMKACWQDPQFIEKVTKNRIAAQLRHPNTSESKLDDWLQFFFPDKFEFVGDDRIHFASKNPDYISKDNSKLIIELLGCSWHDCPICQNSNGLGRDNESVRKSRSELFSQFGYKTLYIWEHELQNEKALLSKIKRFIA